MNNIEKCKNNVDNYSTQNNIVETHKAGNTTIKISDIYYKGKSKEDVNEILNRCANIVSYIYI